MPVVEMRASVPLQPRRLTKSRLVLLFPQLSARFFKPTMSTRPSTTLLPRRCLASSGGSATRVRLHTSDFMRDVARLYCRVNPCCAGEPPSAAELCADLGTPVTSVPWLPGFYSLDGKVKIVRSEAYRTGRIYGIDAASGAAVAALAPRPGDNVLDVCCAPGAKLAMLADWMQRKGTLTGVDVAQVRGCWPLKGRYGGGGVLSRCVFAGAGELLLQHPPQVPHSRRTPRVWRHQRGVTTTSRCR